MTTDLNCVETEIIKLCGIERSEVDQTIADLREHQKETELSVNEQPGEVHLKVTAKAENEKEARKLLKPLVRELRSALVPVSIPQMKTSIWKQL